MLHPNFFDGDQRDNCVVFLRLLRVYCLENYMHAVYRLRAVLSLNRVRFGQSFLVLTTLQYTLVHMTGDYPITEYTTGARVVHVIMIFFGSIFVGAFQGLVSACYIEYLERERELEM